MRIVTFKVDEALLEKIDRFAEREGLTRSEVIREAIIAYLSRSGYRTPSRKMFRVKHVVLT